MGRLRGNMGSGEERIFGDWVLEGDREIELERRRCLEVEERNVG